MKKFFLVFVTFVATFAFADVDRTIVYQVVVDVSGSEVLNLEERLVSKSESINAFESIALDELIADHSKKCIDIFADPGSNSDLTMNMSKTISYMENGKIVTSKVGMNMICRRGSYSSSGSGNF